MQTLNVAGTLAHIPLFHDLPPAHIASIAHGTQIRELARGQRLFHKGDPASHLYYLLEGKIKLAFISEQGMEKVAEILRAEATFGEAAALLGQPYPVFAEALTSVTLMCISRHDLLNVLEEDAQLAMKMITNLSHRLHNLVGEVESICLHSARERVTGYLLRELELQESDGSERVIELPATKAATASLLNLTPETFSRVLHQLEREQVIALQARRIRVLDVAALHVSQHH